MIPLELIGIAAAAFLFVFVYLFRKAEELPAEDEGIQERVKLAYRRCGLKAKLQAVNQPSLAVIECGDFDQQKFNELVMQNKPVLVRGGMNLRKWNPGWTAESLISKLGKKKVPARKNPFVVNNKPPMLEFKQFLVKSDEQSQKTRENNYSARLFVKERIPELAKDLGKGPPVCSAFGPLAAGPSVEIGRKRNVERLQYDNCERLLSTVWGSNKIRLFPPAAAKCLYPMMHRESAYNTWNASAVSKSVQQSKYCTFTPSPRLPPPSHTILLFFAIHNCENLKTAHIEKVLFYSH